MRVSAAMRPLLLAILLALPIPAAAAPWPDGYIGRWAEDPAHCQNSRDTTDEIPIEITRRAIVSYASGCRVLSVSRRGSDVRLRTLCRDEGEDLRDKRKPVIFVLRLGRGRLSLRDGSGERTLTRCPAG